MSVTHDFSAIENLEREFENKRQEELRASVERDMSPLRAREKEANGRAEAQILQAEAERRKKTGYAALAVGVGVGVAAFGLSYLVPPKIIETTKVVTETRTVEVPKIVEAPRIIETTKVVEVPKIIEKPVLPPSAPPAAAPGPGERTTVENFTGSDDYKNTVYRGKMVSHMNGEIRFDNGQSFLDVFPDGTRDFSVNNRRHNGDFAYCAQNGNKFSNGRASYYCYALHNGVVERTNLGAGSSSTSPTPLPAGPPTRPGTSTTADDPFDGLFDLPE